MNKNRLLKFRFWSEKQNKFIDLPRIWIRLNGELNYDFNGEELIVQQFTGLLDRNEKEIYEGDILIYELSYREMMESCGENDIDEVVFKEGCFRLKDGDDLSELVIGNNKLDEQIIGNIFENEGLLNEN